MYLAISGNIGSGKSSLTGLLSERYNLAPVYEAFDQNPYLEDFYRDMRRYSFHSQVFFLSKRLEQHLALINGASGVIQDRTVFEDAGIFARNLFETGQMEARDWETYLGLFQGILPALRAPDLLIHIDASLGTLKGRISKRGRDYEQTIPDAYLRSLNRLYDEWVTLYDHSPVIRVPGDRIDFVQERGGFEWICERIEGLGFGVPLLR
ncbi:deoxynucleoside kinase [Deinococcus peraridilitoris]|uniref:Deoxynucleoside kinase n=1 Tax=Deinococcus peraridilitoris (strain DSM 19664 / LMG 22246 / CIP 109416 / KR-200) TaxID=937777 RepID=L0A2Q3_DEIPD|nr:deoxynucleoside kinase [Deinococcus peraridilitoris]AFZ68158.1 deoxynucleoside kinase [Deinococcus peraridilitoris DSM 19664]